MEVYKSSHGLYWLQYHVVWVTKYRRRILKPFVKEYLQKVLSKLLRSMPGVTIETVGIDSDHHPDGYGNTAKICSIRSDGEIERPIVVPYVKDI